MSDCNCPVPGATCGDSCYQEMLARYPSDRNPEGECSCECHDPIPDDPLDPLDFDPLPLQGSHFIQVADPAQVVREFETAGMHRDEGSGIDAGEQFPQLAASNES